MTFALVLSALVFAPPAQATNGVVKDMTFLLHSVNATETAKPLSGGGSTLTYFDTTLEFNDVNVSLLVEGTQKVLKWFLSPALAGNFSADGFTLRIWANSSTGASSNAQITLGIYELNATTSTLVNQINLGSQSFPVTPTLTAWPSTFAASHTFLPESSIELRMTVTPGALQGVWFHYDTAQFNSRVSFHSPDSMDVSAIVTLDSNRNPRMNFDPTAANKTMYIQARVTDPFGGYDIRWVNLTLTTPSGGVILDNVSMPRTSGTPISYETVFEIAWNYSGRGVGPYTVLVWGLDNNGHNHYVFFQQFTYGDYPDVATSTFFIGGLPAYVNIKVIDSKSVVLVGATVALVSGGFTIDSKIADSNGLVNFSMAKGPYEFQVFWQDVRVGSVAQDVQSNASESNPLVIAAQVYYPIFQAEDSDGAILADASLFFLHPNGDVLGPYKTNDSGQVALQRVPVGTYGITASWRGVDVFSESRDVTSNDIIAFRTFVYKLTVEAKDGTGASLAGVFVSVTDSTGLVFDAGQTGADGAVILRLPAGEYTVQARYITSQLGTFYDSGLRTSQVVVDRSMQTTVTFSDLPLPLTSTLIFGVGLLIAALAVGLSLFFYVLGKRRGSGKPAEAPPEPKQGGEQK